MSVRKQTYRDRKTGEKRRSSHWYVRLRDPFDVMRDVRAFTDQGLSLEYERRLKRLVDCRIMREPPPAELLCWIEGLPQDMQQRLVELHLIDQARMAAMRPVGELVDTWALALRARSNTEHHVRQQCARARRVLAGIRAHAWADVTAPAVESYLAGLRERGLGAQTSNLLLQAIRQLARWLVREGLVHSNPLQHAQPVRVEVDVRRRRAALTVEQGLRLLEVTRAGPFRIGTSGPARALLYRLALETGLRRGEIARLRVCDLRLRDAQPTLRVPASSSKRRREDVIVLRPTLAAELERLVVGRLPTARVWHGAGKRKWIGMLQADCAAAGIPTVTGDGAVIDFHALRHTFATWLALANVPPKVTQSLMRHCTIALTMNVYSHVDRRVQADALRALPELGASAF